MNDLPAQDAYLAAHVQQALAEDERVHEQGIAVVLAGDVVVLSGTVLSEERREAIEVVAREVVGDRPLRNTVTVADLSEPETMERIT